MCYLLPGYMYHELIYNGNPVTWSSFFLFVLDFCFGFFNKHIVSGALHKHHLIATVSLSVFSTSPLLVAWPQQTWPFYWFWLLLLNNSPALYCAASRHRWILFASRRARASFFCCFTTLSLSCVCRALLLYLFWCLLRKVLRPTVSGELERWTGDGGEVVVVVVGVAVMDRERRNWGNGAAVAAAKCVVVSVVVRSLGRNWTRNMLLRSNHFFWG